MKPTVIITSDIGLQEGQPISRLDSYWEAQARKIAWLKDLQESYNCPILDGGDLFEHWKASPFLLQWALKNLPNGIITIPGNHDLPAHNLELYEKSGLAVLEQAEKIIVLKDSSSAVFQNFNVAGFPWGSEFKNECDQVALVHKMTYVGNTWPGNTDPNALVLLKQMEGFDLVICGHNHQHFIVNYKGRKLISPGSLMRTTADQADYQPHVFLWYAETNEIEAIPVPIEKNVISREHLDRKEDKEERFDAFVSRLNNEMEVGLSFEQNMEEYFSKHRTRQQVKDVVWESMERSK